MVIFLDDSLGGGPSKTIAKINSLTVHADLLKFGFVRSLYLTSVVPSVPTGLLSMEADRAPSTPPATISAPFYGYSKL